ncbi:MAG TPA: PBP1A family penicillin-binding protein [Longimicrobium sp.]|nr:PBP1A family penicillin-binding protein [Longimicrobium sp.]
MADVNPGSYFRAVGERLRRWGRAARMPFSHPLAAPRAFAGWLQRSLERDASFFAALFLGGWRGAGHVMRHRVGRRVVVGIAALVGFLATFGWQRCGLRGCPDVRRLGSLQPGGAAIVYDARGNVLGDLAPARWAMVPIADLPDYVPAAFVAVEDQHFYEHGGVHWPRFLAQTARNLLPGGRGAGASTITMQVARNVFPDRLPAAERTIKRKVLEIRVAKEIEKRFSKQQILQTYLNNIYFGEGVYGIQSAARVYFGKNAKDLRLSEAALLAGLPKAPTHYSPRRNLARSVQRRNLVLGLMSAQGRVTAEQAARAKEAPVRLARWRPERRQRPASYFVEQVKRSLEAELGDALYAGGLRIHTTLDPALQRTTEQQVEAQLRSIENGAYGRFLGPRRASFSGEGDPAYLQGSAVVMDVETGDVLALVGGRSYQESAFDRMTQGLRQPGSAFKPFVYAAALEDGIAPTDKVDDDTLRRELPGGEIWIPRNFDGRYRGPVTVRTSLRQSINTVAVQLAERAGLDDVETVARRAGITADIPPLPSVAIGATAVRPMELVSAYTPFATLGRRVEPRWVTRVEDGGGRTIWRRGVRRRRVMDGGVAFLVTNMMRAALDRGTGTAARAALGSSLPAAGKTGTTNGATDAWFVGFTPERLGAVWIGFDRPGTIVQDGSGGRLAAPVWGRIRRAAHRGVETSTWKAPPGVVQRRVTVADDRVIAPGCRARGATYGEYFLRRHVPASICPRGTVRERAEPEGLRGRIERTLTGARTRFREWSRDAWDDARRQLRRIMGREERVEEEPDPAPRRERRRSAPVAPTNEPVRVEPDEAPVNEVIIDTVPQDPEPEPLPGPVEGPTDTLPAPEPEPEPPPDTTAPSHNAALSS